MKTALVIDGNYLLSKDTFVLFYMKSLYVDLENLLRKDIDKLINFFPFDKIYFVSDSKRGYWRRSIYKEYKTKREKNENIDWDWVYEKYDELKEEMKNNPRIEFIEIDECEGDDIIGHLVNNGNKNGYSFFITANDSDIQQLLRFDIHNDYINTMYNFKYSDEKLFLPKNHMVFFKEKDKGTMTLFDMNDDYEYLTFLDEIKNKSKVEEINTEELIFKKIISGDKKDTVDSVYVKNKRGIGDKGAITLYNTYKDIFDDQIDFDNNEFIDNATDIVLENKKIKNIDENDKIILNIKERIKRNRKLKILSDNYLPEYIYNKMKNTIIF